MNEPLCHTLLRAGLTEEDVAARLGVDPKTVRRWMEGRAVPYRRHRWALAVMLDADESGLWPQLRSARSRPEEVQAIYPGLGAVPREAWLGLFGSAKREIGILEDSAVFPAMDSSIFTALAGRAEAGIRGRICVTCSTGAGSVRCAGEVGQNGMGVASIRVTLAQLAPLRRYQTVEVRLAREALYSSIYYADDQLVIAQRVSGIPVRHAPVLHLKRVEGANLFNAYRASFERAWGRAKSPEDGWHGA